MRGDLTTEGSTDLSQKVLQSPLGLRGPLVLVALRNGVVVLLTHRSTTAGACRWWLKGKNCVCHRCTESRDTFPGCGAAPRRDVLFGFVCRHTRHLSECFSESQYKARAAPRHAELTRSLRREPRTPTGDSRARTQGDERPYHQQQKRIVSSALCRDNHLDGMYPPWLGD